MQRSPASPKRVSLVSPHALVLLVGAAAGVLWSLIPGEDQAHVGEHQSELSLAYLRALTRTHPDRPAVRLHYARELLAAGRWQDAEAELEGLRGQGRDDEVEALAIEVDVAQFDAEADPARRADRRSALLARLRQLALRARDTSILERMAELGVRFDAPRLSAEVYERLGEGGGSRGPAWFRLAGKWYRAGGDLDRAGKAFDACAASHGERADALAAAEEAISCALAASARVQALQRCDRYLDVFGPDNALLESCVEAATLADDPQRARLWGRRLVEQAPTDVGKLEAQALRELAVGDTRAALALTRRLVHLAPEREDYREQLAEQAEWSGEPAEALRQWLWVVRRTGSPHARERAAALAQWLRAPRAVDTLLIDHAPAEDLDQATLEQVLAACERAGERDHALQVLRDWLAVHPGARPLWVELAEMLEDAGEASEAALVWAETAARFGLRPSEARRAARLLWKLRLEDEAIRVLAGSIEQASPSDRAFWGQLGRLAYQSGRQDLALQAYLALWRTGVRERDVSTRLISLCGPRQSELGAVVAVDAYARWRDLSAVYAAARLANRDGEALRALALLDLAAEDEQAVRDPLYWSTRGAVLVALERGEEARSHYATAFALAPSNASYAADLLWLDLEHAPSWQLERHLRRCMKIALNNPRLWPAIAVALHRVGRVDDSLVWYRRHALREPDDALWQLAYADALQEAGAPEQADAVRRRMVDEVHAKALQALRHRRFDGQDARLVQARAILARRLEGAPRGHAWLAKLVELSDAPEDRRRAQELAIAWYVSDGDFDLAKKWLLAKHRERIDTALWRHTVAKVSSASLAETDRILSTYSGERPDAAIAAMEASKRAVTRPGPVVEAGLDWQRIGDLDVYGANVASAWSLGDVRMEPRVHGFVLGETDAVPGLDDGELEVDLSLTAWVGRREGRAGLGLGLNDRAGDQVPRATLHLNGVFAPGFTLGARGVWQQIPTDSPLLRAKGVRDDAGLHAAVEPGERAYVGVEAGVFRERSRDGDALSWGGRASAEAGYRLRLEEPNLRVFASGGWAGRELESPDLEAIGIAGPLERWLPERLVTVGAGAQLSRGWDASFGDAPSGLRFMAELWGGYVDPLDEVGVRARGGLSMPIAGDHEVALQGYYLRAVTGTADVALRGASLTYRVGLDRPGPPREGR